MRGSHPDKSRPITATSGMFAALLLCAGMLLSACTSTQDVLEPSALVDTGTQSSTQAGPIAAITASTRLHLAPVVGAPEQAAMPLGARIASRASERGVTLVAAGDGSTTHVIRGYFSTISEGNETTVIYVWDVTDTAGTRIHRIQGQARSTGGEGWNSVNAQTMETIADQTVDQLATWLVASQT